MVQNLNIGQIKIVNGCWMMENDAQALYYALVCINKIIPNLLHRFCNLNYLNHVYHEYGSF